MRVWLSLELANDLFGPRHEDHEKRQHIFYPGRFDSRSPVNNVLGSEAFYSLNGSVSQQSLYPITTYNRARVDEVKVGISTSAAVT